VKRPSIRISQPEAFVSHANAQLTPAGRLRLAQLVVDKKWPLRRAAERWNCSVTTARRWAERYREFGRDGTGCHWPSGHARDTSILRVRLCAVYLLQPFLALEH
jgi:hypothetical protein